MIIRDIIKNVIFLKNELPVKIMTRVTTSSISVCIYNIIYQKTYPFYEHISIYRIMRLSKSVAGADISKMKFHYKSGIRAEDDILNFNFIPENLVEQYKQSFIDFFDESKNKLSNLDYLNKVSSFCRDVYKLIKDNGVKSGDEKPEWLQIMLGTI